MTDPILSLVVERNKAERDLAFARNALNLIADDCKAWLANQCDETCCEMVKMVGKYAREAAK